MPASSLLQKYKTYLLLAGALVMLVIALRLEVSLLGIISIVVGIPLGVLLLDADYLFFSYITDPDHHFSQMTKSLIKERKWEGLLTYFLESKDEPEHLVMRSALFQIILVGLSLFALMSSVGLFQGCLMLGLIFRLAYEQFQQWRATRDLSGWFWNLNIPLNKTSFQVYFAITSAAYIYCFFLLIKL